MDNNSISNDDYFDNSPKIIKEEKIIIKNYDHIKNKFKFIKKNSININDNNPLIIEKNTLRNLIIKNLNINKKKLINPCIYEWNENRRKHSKKVEKIKNIFVKIENLLYSKINLINYKDAINLNDYYMSVNNNSINDKMKTIKNKNILSSIYYEYNRQNSSIKFFSNFQLGNLFVVYKNLKYENKFELIISSDKNMENSSGWFYFKFKGGKINEKYTFKILNIVRNKHLDLKKLAIKSIKYEENNEIILNDWSYYEKNFKFKKNKFSDYYNLIFEYQMRYENEIVYFAENIPYELNRNDKIINKIKKLKNNDKWFIN